MTRFQIQERLLSELNLPLRQTLGFRAAYQIRRSRQAEACAWRAVSHTKTAAKTTEIASIEAMSVAVVLVRHC